MFVLYNCIERKFAKKRDKVSYFCFRFGLFFALSLIGINSSASALSLLLQVLAQKSLALCCVSTLGVPSSLDSTGFASKIQDLSSAQTFVLPLNAESFGVCTKFTILGVPDVEDSSSHNKLAMVVARATSSRKALAC